MAFLPQDLLFEQESRPQPGAVAVFGAPYDCTTSFRPGTRSGPAAIRAISYGLESWSPEQQRDLEDQPLVNLGDLDLTHGSPAPVIAAVRAAVLDLLAQGLKPLMLGGEHSLTAGAVEAVVQQHPDLVVLQMDAHADLRHEYLGERYSHASAMRRCLDVLQPDSLLQLGIRSGTRAEFDEMRATARLLPPDPQALAAALAPYQGRPLYLTLDLDVFDPACFPGTGTPEPGGLFWPQFAALLAVIPDGALVAADLMELSPALDATGCSSILAAKALREIILKMR
jgi:agmatinase